MVTMVQPITQADIKEMLQAFEQSGFASLDLSFGDVRVAINRGGTAAEDLTGTTAVTAPILGIFQSSVTAGASVEPDTIVATLRVLKNVSEVKAGLRGTVAAVAVRDGDLAEFGQTLVHIREATQ
jgi:biotin carboxyl carrier protein